MKADAILNADVLDIIFDNRNKDYGAYSLRKFYNNRLYLALAATVGLAIIFIILTYFAKQTILPIQFISDPYVMNPPPVKADPIPQKPKEKVSPQKPATPLIKPPTQIFTNHVQITKEDKISTIEDLKPNIQIGSEKMEGTLGDVIPIKLSNLPVTYTGGDVEVTKVIVDRNKAGDFAEIMPDYPGGMVALKRFLEKNLKNPQDIEDGKQVKVKIRFIVGYDGNLKGFETIQDGGTAFNNEVIRVLKKMPQWIPGKTKGENVSVYYTIPVNFIATE